MSNNIGRSFAPSRVNPPDFHRGRGSGRGWRSDGVSEAEKFRKAGPGASDKPERASFGGGPVSREFFRSGLKDGGPRSWGASERTPILREPAPQTVERSRGVSIEFESRETTSLEVKTDDGDTVSISFDALKRIQAGVDSQGAHSVLAQSSLNVQVKVNGTLDDEETGQITELLQRLVTTARSDEPAAIKTGGLESLASFHFAYDAYRQAALETLEERFA